MRVTGRVTFVGRPLKDAQVVMLPRIGGKPAQGFTDAGGAYEIETLVTGIYDVSLSDKLRWCRLKRKVYGRRVITTSTTPRQAHAST